MNHPRSLSLLSGNMLKIIALVSMTVDHIGFFLMPKVTVLRIIGRLAMPIFAFMIAEGCFYTRSRKKYFLNVFFIGILCQTVIYFAEKSISQCIMITFSLSILMIFLLDHVCSYTVKGSLASVKVLLWFAFAAALCALYIVTVVLPEVLKGTDFGVDYGFFGVILPVLLYLPYLYIRILRCRADDNKKLPDDRTGLLLDISRYLLLALGLALIAATISLKVQIWSLLAIIPLLLYSGRRGKLNLKYLFYIYYPVHIGIINLIVMLRQVR